jgi:hypothetical protein
MSNISLTLCPLSGLDVSDMAMCCICRQGILLELVTHITAGMVGGLRQPFLTVHLPNLSVVASNKCFVIAETL